jgi:hypothetical protein
LLLFKKQAVAIRGVWWNGFIFCWGSFATVWALEAGRRSGVDLKVGADQENATRVKPLTLRRDEDKTGSEHSAKGQYKGAAWRVEKPAGIFQIGLGGGAGYDGGEYGFAVRQGGHSFSSSVYRQADH